MSPLTAEETNRILQSLSRVYLVGAGGCGVSCIGHLLLDKGCKIAGSDLAANDATQELIKRGADIQTGHEPSHLLGFSPALVVFSSAIPRDNAQLQAALDNKIPIVRRAVLLAGLLRQQSGICVAGMHGKPPTSALLESVLEKLDAHPSYAISTSVPQLTRPARWIQATNLQSRHFFVIEADESDGTLREYLPDYALLVNVDWEHLDYFPDLDAVCTEFSQLAQQTRQLVVYCADDPQLADAVAGINRKVSYGFSAAAQYRIKTAESGSAFRISCDGTELGTFSISLL